MALKYDTQEQAAMRLQNTVITYQDHAVWVREVYMHDGRPYLHLQMYPVRHILGTAVKAPDKAFLRLPADDPDLNFRIFRLGYLNDTLHQDAYYVTRQPRRQQGQGLSRNNLNDLRENTFWTEDFENLLFGRYPTTAEAKQRLMDGGWRRVAINRDFAVARDEDFNMVMKLFYRDAPVGISLSDSKFELSEKYRFLKEVATENNIPFNLV